MIATPKPSKARAGIVLVWIHFYGDDSTRTSRPPVCVTVPDEGGKVIVGQNACKEALKTMPEPEVEARLALQAWIDSWNPK